MSVAQDKILKIAEGLGEFTTGQMALAYRGSMGTEDKTHVWALLNRMVKYGHIEKVGKARSTANQAEILWRYVP